MESRAWIREAQRLARDINVKDQLDDSLARPVYQLFAQLDNYSLMAASEFRQLCLRHGYALPERADLAIAWFDQELG